MVCSTSPKALCKKFHILSGLFGLLLGTLTGVLALMLDR